MIFRDYIKTSDKIDTSLLGNVLNVTEIVKSIYKHSCTIIESTYRSTEETVN
jgi:hypothetical protein